ncbi:FliI/YscN family ATPase [Sphingomonas sp. NIBR02145]|uniref:FliI/YscN family ATPase n=1 Tax=Sphingomonas sp. NIBR02145 TaxID=3014784 RepID=UPI0022B32E37|nr:FliI/YscN family ATPase [Sphingomonas sp. NIBR02145]WHU05001.1 FliI/YscN family ATPase [Sphingomonas sp. NIBR02145]
MTVHPFLQRLRDVELVRPVGFVRKVAHGHLESTGPACTLGDLCEVTGEGGAVLAEVAGVDDGGLILVPLEHNGQIRPGARVQALPSGGAAGVGQGFAGRAIDALGRPFDGMGPIAADAHVSLAGSVLRPLDRGATGRKVATGLRAIDGLLTLAEGQRVGIFAAAGVGKTSLLEQLAGQIECDRCVLCLVGERGREVEGIWRTLSRREDAGRFTLVAATSDETAALRARAVSQALCLAEFWRDQGQHVLLVIDSVTRLAMALREIGLAAGEPPTVRAYTPNVFSALPRLVERCGASTSGGAITAIMTVLSETDDVDDPIVEVMKSLLDGHIVLSRTLAERGHFPAIDISRSISRQAARLMDAAHAGVARTAVSQLGIYDEARVMIESGVYKTGANADIDQAIATRSRLMAFLRQGQDDKVAFADTLSGLRGAVGSAGHA